MPCQRPAQVCGTRGRTLKGRLHLRVHYVVEKHFDAHNRPVMQALGHRAFKLRR
jgi:hypothetical protein